VVVEEGEEVVPPPPPPLPGRAFRRLRWWGRSWPSMLRSRRPQRAALAYQREYLLL